MIDKIILSHLNLIIQNQLDMSTQISDVAANIAQANELQKKIFSEVKSLHDKISAIPSTPADISEEELADLKQKSADLVQALSSIDALTEDAASVPSTDVPSVPVDVPSVPVDETPTTPVEDFPSPAVTDPNTGEPI